MGILKRWYNGEICPVEEIVSESQEYHSIVAEIGEEREYFKKRLSVNDRERFKKWNNLLCEYEKMAEYENFFYGFKLGVMLMFEIFSKEENE